MDYENIKALSERLVKCAGFQPLPGMLFTDRSGSRRADMRVEASMWDERGFWVVSRGSGWTAPSLAGLLPDLSDPLTALGLLALVRRAYESPHASTLHQDDDTVYGGWWEVRTPLRWGSRELGRGVTEIEALVVALEAAPA